MKPLLHTVSSALLAAALVASAARGGPAAKARPFSNPPSSAMTRAAISPDGKTVLAGKGETVEVWDLKSAQARRAPQGSARRRLVSGVRADGAAGYPVCPSYGLTQACSTVTVGEPGDVETHGKPLPGVGVAIAGDGEILSPARPSTRSAASIPAISAGSGPTAA